jgi:hypothetical protein
MTEARPVISLVKRRVQKGETQAARGGGLGLRGDTQLDVAHSPASTALAQHVPVNRLTQVQERFAARGFQLFPLTGEALIVSRWGMTKQLHDLGHAERFLDQIGGANV